MVDLSLVIFGRFLVKDMRPEGVVACFLGIPRSAWLDLTHPLASKSFTAPLDIHCTRIIDVKDPADHPADKCVYSHCMQSAVSDWKVRTFSSFGSSSMRGSLGDRGDGCTKANDQAPSLRITQD